MCIKIQTIVDFKADPTKVWTKKKQQQQQINGCTIKADTNIRANELFSVFAGHLNKLTTQEPGQETFGELHTASCECVTSLTLNTRP